MTTLEGAVFSSMQVLRREFGSIWIRLTQLTRSCFISLAPSVGNSIDIFVFRFENTISINFYIQMESNQDSAALAQQVQALAAIVEELAKQNQEMKLRLRQKENRTKDNLEDERDSHRRSDRQRPTSPDEQSSDLLREMRREMDKLRSAIKEKTDRSLGRLVRATDSPFTMAVLECPIPSKVQLPQLEPFNELKDPQDHFNTFKTVLGIQ